MRNSKRFLSICSGIAAAISMVPSVSISAEDCANGVPWQASQTYTQGQKVIYDNSLYEAVWWTQNQQPSSIDANGPWAQVAQCALEQHNTCGVSDWNKSSIYNNGRRVVYQGFSYTAQWWTRGQTPSLGNVWLKGESCSPIIDEEEEICTETKSIALVVDAAFTIPLQTEITRLADDIKAEQNVCIKKIEVNSLTTPVYIRTQLKLAFQNNGLLGAVLIGDVPGVSVGDYSANGQLLSSSLTDGYYEVLNDAVWNDPDNDGVFNRAESIQGNGTDQIIYHTRSPANQRSVWSGRLTPPKGLAVSERAAMLRAYLNRNHAYRTGQKPYEKSMIYFNSLANNQLPIDYELDQVTNQTQANDFFHSTGLYSAVGGNSLVTIWNADLDQQLNLWKTSIQQPVEYAYVSVHGAPDFQQFGFNQFLSGMDLLTNKPNVLLTDLASCNNGMYESSHYMAGYALFSGESLAVRAFTTPVFFVGNPQAGPDQVLLALGKTLGEIRQLTDNEFVSVLLGDPTLRLRSQSESGPRVELDTSDIIFPDRYASESPLVQMKSVRFTNTGNQSIKIFRGVDQNSAWNGLGTLNRSKLNENGFSTGIDPVFIAEFQNANILFAELSPGQSVNLPIYFASDFADPLPGEYKWQQVFFTNSPAQPKIVIDVSQRLL